MRFKLLLISGLLGVGLLLLLFSYSSSTYISDNNSEEVETAWQFVAAQAISAKSESADGIWQSVLEQLDGVWDFTAQAIQSIGNVPSQFFDIVSNNPPESSEDVEGSNLAINTNDALPYVPAPHIYGGTLIVNVPLEATDTLTVAGETTIGENLSVTGGASFGGISAGSGQLGSLSVSGNTRLNTLSVSGPVSFANLTAGSLSVTGAMTALGGINTSGADVDLQGGNIFAANIINQLIEGDNIEIEGSDGEYTISADVPSLGSRVRSLNGSSGSLTIVAGDDIAITDATLAIDNTSTLDSVAARGGCVDCILDADIVDALTIASGTIDGTVIGSTTPALATFTNVTVTGSATSTYSASIDVIGTGCVAVNGICLGGGVRDLEDLTDVTFSGVPTAGEFLVYDGSVWENGAPGALGLGDGTFLGLSDTPASYAVGAVMFASSTGTSLAQSTGLTFDGAQLAVGSTTPVSTLTVNGDVSVVSGQSIHFYDSNNTGYVGFQASTTLSGNTVWTLPEGDGAADEVMVTDGSGNLRFVDINSLGAVTSLPDLSDVTLTAPGAGEILTYNGSNWVNIATSSVGLGDGTFIGLSDTPASYATGAVIYSNGSTLAQSTNFVFDGTQLAVGTSSAVTALTVAGDISILGQQETHYYDSTNTNYVGFRASSTLSGNTVWTLPVSDGVANDIVVTDGAGNLSFANPAVLGLVSELNDLSDVTLAATSTGDLLSFDGTDWVNVASTTLGLGDGTFLGLTDTPASYTSNAVTFINAAGNAIAQSNNFIFDGTQLAVGTSSAVTTVTVDGDVSILGGQNMRFYDTDSSNYVGFTSSSSLSGNTVWTLPDGDGLANHILVTDGAGNLRFESVGVIGGGVSNYIDLDDTPAAWLPNAIPYVSTTSAIAFSSELTFDGDNGYVGIGTDAPTSELTVHGSVYFGYDAVNPGLVYQDNTTEVGIGVLDPAERLHIEGGSILQRGGTSSDLYTPEVVSAIELNGNVNKVFIYSEKAYVVSNNSTNEFRIINISDKTNPNVLGSVNLPNTARDVFVQNKYAYVVTDAPTRSLHVIDVSNSTAPVQVGSLILPTSGTSVIVRDRYAYVTNDNSSNQFHIIDVVDPTSPREVGSVPIDADVNDVKVKGDYAFVVTDTPDAIVSVDISDPASPVVVGTTTVLSNLVALQIKGNYTYVVGGPTDDELYIMDISDPTNVTEVGSLSLASGATDISISGEYAYVTTSGTGDDLHVVDISDKSNPEEIGGVDLNVPVNGVHVAGRYAYMVSGNTGNDFHIFDVTGVEAQTVLAHSLESGSLSVLGDIVAAGAMSLVSGLNVGGVGIQTDGSLLVQGTEESIISGNLAIGTTSAPQALTVEGDISVSGSIYDSGLNAGTYGQLLMANGVGQVWTATSSLGLSSEFTTSADLAALLSDTTGTGSIVFSTAPSFTGSVEMATLNVSSTLSMIGTAANISLGSNYLSGDGDDEGIFVTSGGLVGIGTTTPISTLSIEGTIMASNLLGGATGLSTDAQGNIIRDPSDVNLKKNIVEIEGALEKVLALRGVTYEWIDLERFGSQTEVGFIAQEVDLILPEVIRKGGGYWSLNTQNIVAVVVEAVQDVWEKVVGNQDKIETLEDRVIYLESLLDVESAEVGEDSSEEEEEGASDVDEEETIATSTTVVSDQASSTDEVFDDSEESEEGVGETATTTETIADSEENGEAEVQSGEEEQEPESTDAENVPEPEFVAEEVLEESVEAEENLDLEP